MNYIIREAKLEDTKTTDELLTLLIRDEKQYDKNINEKFTVEKFYKNIIKYDSNIILVAESNNKIIGYLYGYIVNNGNAYINKISKLEAMFVLPIYRNLGVATSLINEFKKWSIKNNIKYIEVQVLNNNTNAFNLYNKEGFKEFKSTLINEIKDIE